MAAQHPRAELASWPTPLEPAPRLAVGLGLEPGGLWIKRDDLTGLGGGGRRTVFLHSGGLPGLFGHPDTVRRAAGSLR